MRRLLERVFPFLKSPQRPARVVCYLRENGPIAYAVDLFSSAPRESVDAMMSSGIVWSWRSAARGWTELTRVSLSAFLADLASGDLLLAGIEGEHEAGVADADLRDWIRRFCREDPSPLALAISASGDRQLLFVQQHASEAVNALLEAWRIDKRAAERKAYARLGPASLEATADSLDQQ